MKYIRILKPEPDSAGKHQVAKTVFFFKHTNARAGQCRETPRIFFRKQKIYLCLSTCLSVCLSVFLSVFLSVCL